MAPPNHCPGQAPSSCGPEQRAGEPGLNMHTPKILTVGHQEGGPVAFLSQIVPMSGITSSCQAGMGTW